MRFSLFQSTLPVWGATRLYWKRKLCLLAISIHAPRVGSDLADKVLVLPLLNFNPRSPCGERPNHHLRNHALSLFQSTLPVWGATTKACLSGTRLSYFNPRSPCGERLFSSSGCVRLCNFNPRSPCGERLHRQGTRPITNQDFNPRSPCGERRTVTTTQTSP